MSRGGFYEEEGFDPADWGFTDMDDYEREFEARMRFKQMILDYD